MVFSRERQESWSVEIMDVTVVRSLSGIEARLDSCIDTSPSFLSRFFSFPGIEIAAQSQTFWTWSAFVLALIAALSKLSAALNVLIRAKKSGSAACPTSQPLLKNLGDEDDLSGDEDEETTSAASEGDKDDDDEPTPSSSRRRLPVYEDHSVRVAGFWDFYMDRGQTHNFNLRPRRSLSPWLSEVAAGNNVVKLWGDCDVGRPLLDADGGSRRIPGATVASSSALVAAVSDDSRNLSLSVWDRRIGRRTPAICAEWMTSPRMSSAGDGSSNGLKVGDLRNVSSPVAKLRVAGEGTWWDADANADAAVVTSDAVGDGGVNGCDPSIATRWLDVVWRYLL